VAVASDAGAAPRPSSPVAYTPKHLAERILNSTSAIAGERKQVTVLFADLKGSMELLADRDPEEARALLDPVLERMMEAVHRYEGTVNQVMGDGIMALFGAPLAHEDHAVRACYAALRMQEAVKRYAEEIRREQGVAIRIRVGLNSGEVVVRAIGSDLHMDYTAVGQTTHLAARMEQLADPGSILLTPGTLGLAEGFVQVTSLGRVAVKGLADAVEVYELTGVSAARSRLQAAASRGLSQFVGRDVEIEQLRRALEQARAGRGQIVAVVGEPGVGKSRLALELTRSHRVADWLVLESGAVSYGKATSYGPVIELLKAYFRVGDRDTPREIREKVTGKVLALDRALEPALPPLLALLEVLGEDPAWQALDAPRRRQRTLESVKRLLLRESQVQPLLLVFEDLHWIDSETQALLDGLVESLPTARLLLLVNYRPEYAHGWSGKTSYAQLRLDPLPPESAIELLRHLLGGDDALERLGAMLIARTQGNPFFLEESIRTLAETGVLVGGRGAYRLARALADVQVPSTVQAILAARIDRLSPEDKDLLQSAAVIGKDVPLPLLAAIADRPEEDLRGALAHLQAAEFLYEVSHFPDLEYTFKHALTHDVAYGGLLHERRRATHARIVEVAETLYGDRMVEQVERVANHAFRGEEWAQAVTYATQAGRKAAGRRAHHEAVTWFEQALAALARLPVTPEHQARAVDLRLDIRVSLVSRGDFASVLPHLDQAMPLAEALGDLGRQSAIATGRAHTLWASGHFRPALEAGEKAVELASRAGDLRGQLSAAFVVGEIFYALGDYRQAIARFASNIEAESLDPIRRRQPIGAAIPGVVNRRWLAMSLAEVGRFPEAIATGTEAVELAEAAGHPYSLINALVGLGVTLVRKGEIDRAVSLLERAHEVSGTLGFTMWEAWAVPLAAAYGSTGRTAAAASLLTDPRIEEGYPHSGSVAEGFLLCGRLADAARRAERDLAHARGHGSRAEEARALFVLGVLGAAEDRGNLELARDHLRRALALAEAAGMRPLVARIHAELGELARRAGRDQEAETHLAAAATMFREMDIRRGRESGPGEAPALRHEGGRD
jgi:class 3 adenylate cyclase/tetratricopeptide (TPR) repeat protein